MRVLIALLLGAGLAASALTGCGGGQKVDRKQMEKDHQSSQQALDRAERNEEIKQDREAEE